MSGDGQGRANLHWVVMLRSPNKGLNKQGEQALWIPGGRTFQVGAY